VGLVEDEEGGDAGELAEPVAQRGGVGLVAQERVRDDEAGVGGPRVDAVAALAAAGGDVVAVEMTKVRPKRCSISSCHWRTTEGGQATTTRRTRWRRSSSRRMRPASMVLPRPTSSAMKRFTRGMARALRSGSSW
jgi:hypothetical protein